MDKQKDLYKYMLYYYSLYLAPHLCLKFNEPSRVTFFIDLNEILEIGSIPDNVTHLNCKNNCKQPLQLGVIPSSVTHLDFSKNFNTPLRVGVIPSSVTHLTFGFDFKQSLHVGIIPSSVTHLTLTRLDFFTSSKENLVIPSSVTHLTLGQWCCMETIIRKKIIPPTVTHLTILSTFGPVLTDDMIPENIISLVIYIDYFKNCLLSESFLNSIIFGINDGYFNVYENKFAISCSFHQKMFLNKYIEEYSSKDKFIGNVIFEELCQKVCNPKRLINIGKIYGDYDLYDVIDMIN